MRVRLGNACRPWRGRRANKGFRRHLCVFVPSQAGRGRLYLKI
ncbi:hypothetical protein NEILACOT_03964 [Neisseria lactamica ATCC 23970]|uniref:Uncharacterized protein n=1 Tax=Neisseria lactamica ATCC 23970 TaxID=546265 RepID=D0W8W0_NEILA|nr:hypothetical protein NEILACOT_03964 [Neisseria lactamica ATCC 23970]